MVEFVSLLLGLVIGPIDVEVAVDETVAAVVLELDGEEVGRLAGAPWKLSVDLGEELRPHRLTARALDGGGRELDHAERQLNVYRPPAGVDYVLHRNSSGWVTKIALSWPNRAGAEPRRSAVSVDGSPVEFEDPSEIWPPALDPSRLHVIETVVEYSDGVVARDRIGVGGPVLGQGSVRLTALVAHVPEADARAAPETARARRTGTGERVRVVGIERRDAEMVFVRGELAASAVERIGPGRATMGALSGARDAQAARVIHAVPIEREEWVRIFDPHGSVRRGDSLEHQRLAVPLVSGLEGNFGLFWHLKTHKASESDGSVHWLADAVAIAASRLESGARRRAAVLLLAPESIDQGSLLDAAGARTYLEALGVPLHVWYLGKTQKAPTAWGSPLGVRSVAGLQKALDSLRSELERQRIVWADGIYLPGEVEVEIGPRPGPDS